MSRQVTLAGQAPAGQGVGQTVSIPLDVAVLVVGAFLPLNPNKLRNATPEVKAAAHAFKNAVHKVIQDNALSRATGSQP